MNRRPLVTLACVLALAIGVTGCTATRPAEFSTPPPPENVDLDHVVLPLDAYQLSDSQFVRMDTEWADLMTRCVATYGAKLSFGSDYTRDPADKSLLWGGPFGTLSLKQAASFGYHAPPDSPVAPASGFYLRSPDNIFIAGKASPEDQLIAFGRSKLKNDPINALPLPKNQAGEPLPAAGCWGSIQRRLGAPLESDLDVRNHLVELSFHDPKTQRAVAKWSSCMAAAGHPFDKPQQAEATAGYLTSAETTLAVSDVTCTASSGWASDFYGLLVAYQKQAIEKEPQVFQGVLRSQQRILKALDSLAAQ